jgi:hypothetical protein
MWYRHLLVWFTMDWKKSLTAAEGASFDGCQATALQGVLYIWSAARIVEDRNRDIAAGGLSQLEGLTMNDVAYG